MPGFAQIRIISESVPRGAMVVFSGRARQKLATDEPFASRLHIDGGMAGAVKRVLT